MISKLLIAWSLMALCVVIHATGVASAHALAAQPVGYTAGILALDLAVYPPGGLNNFSLHL